MDKEAFAGIRGVLLCQRVNALPCSQIVIAGAGLGCPPVKQRPVDKQHLRGFGKGQNRLPPADHPLLTKGRDKRRQLLLAEIIPIVHQYALIRQRQHRLGIGYEHIRQRRCARVAVGGGQHAFMNTAAVADQLHLHADVLLCAHGAVEPLDQAVQRGIHLAAIDVPQRYGQWFRLLFLRASCHQQERQRQQAQNDSSFHVRVSPFREKYRGIRCPGCLRRQSVSGAPSLQAAGRNDPCRLRKANFTSLLCAFCQRPIRCRSAPAETALHTARYPHRPSWGM